MGAILSCPLIASNYANSYLVPISFWSRSGCWPFLGLFILFLFYRHASRFVVFQTKVTHSCFCLVRIKMPSLTCFWQRSLTAKQLLHEAKGRKNCKKNNHPESAFGSSWVGPLGRRRSLSEIGEECRRWILGVNFLGGLRPWKNKAEKIAEKMSCRNSMRNSPALFLKFAGPNKKKLPQIRSENLPQLLGEISIFPHSCGKLSPQGIFKLIFSLFQLARQKANLAR